MNYINHINWMTMLNCFLVGGFICVIGQILIDKTKLSPAKILVIYVTTGVILGSLGLYKYIIDGNWEINPNEQNVKGNDGITNNVINV